MLFLMRSASKDCEGCIASSREKQTNGHVVTPCLCVSAAILPPAPLSCLQCPCRCAAVLLPHLLAVSLPLRRCAAVTNVLPCALVRDSHARAAVAVGLLPTAVPR
jgi:hypothetical protein